MLPTRLAFLLCFVVVAGWSQTDRYMVFFRDKTNTPYSIQSPEAYLSPKAIKRRSKGGVAVNADDLPVDPSYVSQVKAQGAKVFFTSRWFNGVLVEASSAMALTLAGLPFVKKIEYVAPGHKLLGGRKIQKQVSNQTATTIDIYTQLDMIGLQGNVKYEDGFWGNGITISILDAGFPGVNDPTNHPLRGPFTSGRILMTHDFVTNSGQVYQFDQHGTEVFSVVAACCVEDKTGFDVLTGGAPSANFLLFVTEDVSSEYRVEEYNWLFAAEKADSAGTDIIQSSLGYNQFDDPAMDYKLSSLDGKTTVISRAASMARDRAIVVVVSAGNEGQGPWHYITAPADADGILATGAVNSSRLKAGFSSFGPTADGRIKPDVAAMGQNTAVVLPNGSLSTASGTSLAAPLVTSLVAVLMQAYPDLRPAALVQAIKVSASQGSNPDNNLGFGIPNYQAVKNYLASDAATTDMFLYPIPAKDNLQVAFKKLPDGPIELTFFDMAGRILTDQTATLTWLQNPLQISLENLSAGSYILKATTSSQVFTVRFVKY